MSEVPNYIMGACWLAFIAYWVIASIGIKRDASRQGSPLVWIGGRLLLVVIIVLLVRRHYIAVLQTAINGFTLTHPTVQAIGAGLCVAGLALAIWARATLGANWSASPATKASHELVTSGPYRRVRHPIYTGMLVMMLGTACIAGIVGVLVLVAFAVVVAWRIRVEERLMVELFPGVYEEYRKRTRALVPFIL